MSSADFLFSERQQRMLAALILHPKRQYGTNELLAIGGPGVGAGRNAIKAFDRAGIIKKSARGNQVAYSIDVDHPIYPELRSICLKTFGMSDLVAKELQRFADRIQMAFLFGSMVDGNERPDSDVDLMIVGTLDVFALGESVERLQSTLGRQIDLNLHTPDEWRSLATDRVIGKIMNGNRIMIALRGNDG
ncbi:nucleotidyltransferase domain-containing protein [Rhizobium ruizarguesonis]